MMKLFYSLLIAFAFISCDTPPSVNHKVGESRSLIMNGQKMVVVPKTKEVLDRTIQLGIAGDDDGIARQVAKGEAMLVPEYTGVKIINVSSTVTEVKIEGGPYSGTYGFVRNEFIQ